MAQIAVIVPVYNSSEYLGTCVDSILGQTYQDYELILVDDGSTDDSGSLCDAYAAQDPRVRVVHQRNGGLVSAWTRGVKESKAPYLFFVDSDDWVDRDALEVLSQGLSHAAIDSVSDLITQGLSHADSAKQIVCAGCVIEREWNHTRSQEGNAAPAGVYEGERLQTEIKNQLLGNEYRRILPSRCMKLIDRRLIERNMKYSDPSIRMGEDLNIMVPAMLDADRIVLLDNAYLYHYRFVSESMVHSYDAEIYSNMQRLVEALRRVYADKKVPDGKAQVDREFVYLFLLVLKNEIRRNASVDEIVRVIQNLCEKEHSARMLETIGGRETLTNRANRLLGWIMENPSGFRIRTARAIFRMKG